MSETGAVSGEDVSHDTLLGGAIALLQPRRGHRAGTDAVLLAQLAPVRPRDTVLDLGAASGAVGLMIANREPTARIVFVERNPALVALCAQNIALNGLGDRAEAVAADIFDRSLVGRQVGQADLVVTNPPFFEEGAGRSTPDPGRRAAHVMRGGTLDEWVAGAARLLRPNGRLYLIHRADRLADCLRAVTPAFGGAELTFVHPSETAAATRLLLSAVLGHRGPLVIGPPLVLHGADGALTEAARILHGNPAFRSGPM